MMKKIIILLLVVVMALSLCACGQSATTVAPTETTPTETTPTETTPTETTPAETTPTEPPVEEDPKWKIAQYVDEFGDSTGGDYIQSHIIQGTFSNTATSGSELAVIVYYEPDFIHFDDPTTIHSTAYDTTISFRLFEYGSSIATYYSSSEMKLSFKVDGETYTINLKGSAPNGDVFFLEDAWKKSNSESEREKFPSRIFARALERGKEIKCVIYIDNSKYSFVIDPTGYADILSELKSKYNYRF